MKLKIIKSDNCEKAKITLLDDFNNVHDISNLVCSYSINANFLDSIPKVELKFMENNDFKIHVPVGDDTLIELKKCVDDELSKRFGEKL